MNYQNNGRISYVDRMIYPEYQMFSQNTKGLDGFKSEAVKTILQRSDLSDVYFSKQNIDYLQNRIQQRVYELSGGRHRIGRQSDTELEIIMRSYFLQFSLNQFDNIREQVRVLDDMVLDEVVPQILSAVEQYIKFKDDINSMYIPVNLPEFSNSKGEKTLELKPWF